MKIKKAQLETLISMNREYWSLRVFDGETIRSKCRTMHLYATKTFGVDLGKVLQDVVGGTLRYRGLKPDATNEDIYKVLEVLGYEVVE